MDTVSSFEQLAAQLRQWDGRRRLAMAAVWLPRGLLAGLLAAAVVATVARLRPVLTNDEVGLFAAGLATMGIIVTALVVWLQRRTMARQARFGDRQFHLQERASTAVEIHTGRLETTPNLARQQLEDTLRAAAAVNVRAALPLRLQWRDLAITMVAAVLLAAAVLLPNPQAALLLQQRAVGQAIQEQVETLEAVVEEIEQNPALSEAQRESLNEPLQQAIEQLQTGELSQEEAVAVLSEAEADLHELGEATGAAQLRQTLQSAGEPLAGNPAAQSLGAALQSGDLAAAGAAAAQLADNLPSLTPEEQAELAADLAEAAAALQTADSELAGDLVRAADALQQGDGAAAQQALREAAATLQERTQEAAAEAQAEAAAEALNEGRREVAQAGQSEGNGQSAEGSEQSGPTGENQGQAQAGGSGANQENGNGSSSGADGGSGQEGGSGGITPGGGHAESVFVPEFREPGEEGVEVELPAECRANPAACGALISEQTAEFGEETSQVPYDQVFGDYRDAAYEALTDEYIPLGLKSYIRDYFSSLEP